MIVDFYEQVGYLPDAILNYLLLLGWSLDDKREEFTRAEMIEHFSLERVNKAPASFDPKKLLAFQDRAMQKLPLKQKVAKCLPFLQRAGLVADPPPCDTGPYLTQILAAAGDRVKVAGDVLDYADFFTRGRCSCAYDEAALEKRIASPPAPVSCLAAFSAGLDGVEPFDAAGARKVPARVRRGARHQDRRRRARRARRGHRQSRRLRPVRCPGDPGPRARAATHRAGDRVSLANRRRRRRRRLRRHRPRLVRRGHVRDRRRPPPPSRPRSPF